MNSQIDFSNELRQRIMQALAGNAGFSQPFQGRQHPMQSAPIPQPGNLSSIFAGAGPHMMQALNLAGQQRPVASPTPGKGPGSTLNTPPNVHVAPPSNSFQGRFGIPGINSWMSHSPSAGMPWLKLLKGLM